MNDFEELNDPDDQSAEDAPEFSERRRELVRRAVDAWKKQLIDLGGRNNLLAYRDLKAGTLDFSTADSRALDDLIAGKAVPLSRLWRDPEQLADAERRGRTIHKKALEHFEERGVETLFLAYGLASWKPGALSLKNPKAPVLIRPAALVPRGAAQQDFQLVLLGEMRVSDTLLHVLATEFDLRPDSDQLEVDGVIDTREELSGALDWLEQEARRVPEFAIERRAVLGTFSYMKLPMVRDLEESLDLLLAHDLVATIAGDDEARAAFREAQGTVTVALDDPNRTPPRDEFLVLDADSSQNWAVNAVLRGQSLIVRGPPGTGKSQTISNLIASLTARGKRVLFVAEKRAAIDAVLKRLEQVGLSDLVFDIHGGVAARRAVAQQLADSIERSRGIAAFDSSKTHRELERARGELLAASEALHRKRDPFGISALDAMEGSLATPAPAHTTFRLRGGALAELGKEQADRAAQAVEDLARLGGLELERSGSQWAGATVGSQEEARDAYETIARLRSTVLPAVQKELQEAALETDAEVPDEVDRWAGLVTLWEGIAATLESAEPSIYELDLAAVTTALDPADDGLMSRAWATISSGDYRASNASVKATLREERSAAQRLELAQQALAQRSTWSEFVRSDGRLPSAPANLANVRGAIDQLDAELRNLRRYLGDHRLRGLTDEDLWWELDELYRDQPTLTKLPRIHGLEHELAGLGFNDLVTELRHGALTPELSAASLRFAWWESVIEHVRLEDPLIGSFDAAQHSATVARYRDLDSKHLETTSDRILRLWAERSAVAREDYPDDVALIRQQAGRKRKLLPFRELFAGAENYLLELKPCWVMSPLVVSQTLPPERLFDVVIFDEASQVRPADAMPAVARGTQLVVAGDEKQLPPTAFFLASTPEEEDAELEEGAPQLAAVEGFESILDALGMLLPARTLEWHYRSRDERLIAFSNGHFYDWHLTTFPGIGDTEVINHILVPHRLGVVGQEESASDEVREVVRLVLEHAETRPQESLGVITMGIKHADRVEAALFEALRERPDLDPFFTEASEERFFVKNLERVQGDERDAVILSIGYGKTPEGRLLYRFGPLNLEGGARRLNVAVTRARRRLALVSSFGTADMDPNRPMSEGAQILRDYLRFAESGGSNLGERALDRPALNPFEIDVRDALARAGVSVVPQLGVCGYLIDFAVQHPRHLGRFVLAIECDGASYHSSPTTRDRDRLRQEQLERLGWRFYRIWSTDWFSRKEESVQRVLDAIEEAVRIADNPELAAPRSAEPRAARTNGGRASRDRRPNVRRYQSIDAYSHRELVEIVRWVSTDTLPRTDEEFLLEVMDDLGFQRRGSKIVSRISAAVREFRAAASVA
jgi:very-short-patch-repair endonuclease